MPRRDRFAGTRYNDNLCDDYYHARFILTKICEYFTLYNN